MDVFCDAIVRVSFLTTEQGGLKEPWQQGKLNCPMLLDGRLFDCSLILEDLVPVVPGSVLETPVLFLDPKALRNTLAVGQHFELHYIRKIAAGEVLVLVWGSDFSVRTPPELYESIRNLANALDTGSDGARANALRDALQGETTDEIFTALRRELKSLPSGGPFDRRDIAWRIDRALRFIESRRNAWPST